MQEAPPFKLLPCPFCGSVAAFVTSRDGRWADAYRIRFTSCFADAPGGFQEDMRATVAAWNMRAP